MLIVPNEIVTGALVNAITLVGRQVSKAASGLRKPDDDLMTARWFETFRLTATPPELPDLSAAAAERLAGILASAEVQEALQQLLAIRLTDAPETNASRARDALQDVVAAADPDMAAFAGTLAGYYDDQICALVARLEGEEPSLLAQIRSEAFYSRIISIMQAIEQHTAALADDERGHGDSLRAGRYAVSAQTVQVGSYNSQINIHGWPTGGPAVRLQPRPAFLSGREGLLTEIRGRLSAGNETSPQITALCGLGGCGKTSAAVEYAYRHLAEFGVIWQLTAENPTAMAAGFGDLAAQLGVRSFLDPGDPVAQVHAALASCPKEWLLILDNAPSAAAVREVLPPAGRGQVLVTSQDPHWPGGWALEVPVLDQAAAAGFLQARTGADDSRAVRDLADELGGLPLALEQAAAFIETSGMSVSSYLALFQEHSPELLARGQPAWYGKQVMTCWSLAFEKVQEAVPHAAGLLRLTACLAPDRIPVALLLRHGSGRLVIPPEVRADLLPLLDNPLAVADAISVLRRYSLITGTGDGIISVHRLVQAVTLAELPAGRVAAWRRAARSLLEAQLVGDPEAPANWPVYAVLLPHAQVALPADSRSIAKTARYLGRIGNYAAARTQQELILNARERTLGADHIKTLAARDQLAHFIGAGGDASRARDLYAALARHQERTYGANHARTLAALGNLAYWTGKAGSPAEARDQLAELLPVLGRVLGPDHPRTLAARANHARWTGEAGNPATARDQLTALLPLIVRTFGPKHPRTLATAANQAIWTGEAGDAAAARDQLAALLPIQQEVSGPSHPYTLAARARLADWTARAGDRAQARNQLIPLLPLMEQALGPDHPDTVAARTSLANCADESRFR